MQKWPGTSRFRVFLPLLLAALGCVVSACKTVSPSGASVTASQVVEGATMAQILSATRAVFQERGYEMQPAPGYKLIFDKAASTWSNLVYGDFSTSGVWVRARIEVTSLGSGRHVIDCKATYLRSRGEFGIEDEQAGPRSPEFREILKEVSKRLATPPGK